MTSCTRWTCTRLSSLTTCTISAKLESLGNVECGYALEGLHKRSHWGSDFRRSLFPKCVGYIILILTVNTKVTTNSSYVKVLLLRINRSCLNKRGFFGIIGEHMSEHE